MRLYKFIFIIFCFLYSNAIFAANLSITEIMYDLDGGDSGREWIEVYNNSGSSIDLTQYKFFESGTAHSITHYEGSFELANGAYAVIADNGSNFLNDYPNFSKMNLYDSSFSLTNDPGETLMIKDGNGGILFEVTYDTKTGAMGDGKSLQKNSSGSWVASAPTPGSGLGTNQSTNNDTKQLDSKTGDNTTITAVSGTAFIPYSKDPIMQLNIDSPKTNIIGRKTNFKPTLYGFGGENINQGVFIWNFGDGHTVSLDSNQSIDHVYNFPGNYIVSCSYKYASWYPKTIVVGKTKISIVDSPIVLKELYLQPTPAILISNTKDNEYDISGYIIQTDIQNIIIPEGTYIGAKDDIVINLPLGSYKKDNIKILAPSGLVSTSFDINKNLVNNMVENKILKKQIAVGTNPVQYQNTDDFYLPTIPLNPVSFSLDDENPSKSKDGLPVYIGLIFVILGSGGFIIFLRFKIFPRKLDDSDEYSLQDE